MIVMTGLRGQKGQENEPERGKRCTTCFDMRFERTARYASENNFDIISSTLGISRWKDMNQINDSGARSSKPHNVPYWDFNWRKKRWLFKNAGVIKKRKFLSARVLWLCIFFERYQ